MWKWTGALTIYLFIHLFICASYQDLVHLLYKTHVFTVNVHLRMTVFIHFV